MRRLVIALVSLVCSTAVALGQPQKSATEWLADPSHASRIAAAERDLAAAIPGEAEPLRLTLQRWMELYKIPGLTPRTTTRRKC